MKTVNEAEVAAAYSEFERKRDAWRRSLPLPRMDAPVSDAELDQAFFGAEMPK